MNNKFKQTVKRIISGIVAAVTAITMFPAHFAMAEEVGRYPYTLFAASSEEGAITVNAGNFCVNGNVATNGTIASSGNMNINGTKTENAGLDMIYVFDKIDSRFFSGTNVDEHSEDYTLDEINININEPTEVYGEAELTGNININTALKAFEDITLNGEVKNTNDSVIFSKYGDVVIDSTNVNLNGLVYAPFGSVKVKAMNLNLNNVVIIADSILLDCPNVNANYSTNAADFVGTISEPLNIPKDDWQYMKDENGNGLPDFFENFENWGKLADTDGDGLPDSIEEYLGSDSNNIDTDGDGLNDYYEVFGTYTDPAKADTDENGVSDADEDFDEDNLTNFEEFINKTNPYIDDMDNDGLSDGDEIKVYGTDPLVADTDGDELEDGDEIILGTNPLVQDTDGDGIIDSKEKFQQTFTHKVKNEDCAVTEVIVDMECTGNIKRTTTVESIMGVDYLCSEVVGLVGEPFEIETTSEFDKATLTFRLNTERIETGLDNLMFLWYDEDNRVFRNINTSYDVENSTVTIETTHFSKYMVVDSTEWFEVWKNALVYDSEMAGGYSNIDTVLALDFSGSMSYSEKVMAKQAALSYVETMKPGDRTAIVTYGIRANAIIGLTNDVDALKACLNGYLSSDGGTNFNSAVNVSAKALSGSTASKKIIILMSDGQSTISNSTLNALDSDIVIHTIGLRTGSYSLALSEIASKTGGKYYKAATASDLIDIYSNIGLTNSYIGEDTDKDGIADIFEISGMMLTNGNIIITDPLKADTDGDMLVDGDEITIIRNFKELVTESYPVPKYTYVFDIKSNPHSGDYDDSGVSDYDEANGTVIYGKSYYVSSLNGDIINIPVGTVAYGYPNTSCGEAFIAKEVSQDFQYHASALIYANGEYWIKVFSQNEYDVWGYIIVDEESNNSLSNIIKDSWLWKLSHGVVKVPYYCNASCEYINYKHTNEAGKNDKIEIDETVLAYIGESCNKVKKLYNSSYLGENSNVIRRIINNYLNPELIVAISGTESGYFLTLNGGGLGLTSGGVKYIGNMIGAEGLSTNFDDYKGNLENSIYVGAVMIAHNIKYALENNIYSVYDKNNNLSDAQVIFNAFYFYGSGTGTRNYYGYRNNGEGGMSSGYKMYIYSTICEQVDSICAIPFGDYNTRISALTKTDDIIRWKYIFSEDKLY